MGWAATTVTTVDTGSRRLAGLVAPEALGVLLQVTRAWVAAEVLEVVRTSLGADYPWPGNIRELAQCVRNVLVRIEYRPPAAPERDRAGLKGFLASIEEGALTAEAALSGYATIVYARCGTYEEAARRLGLDRRTVKARIDAQLLTRLRTGTEAWDRH